MNNPYIQHYVNQAGTGIAGYEGVRYQRGHNFFGRAIKFLFPVLKFLGRHALSTGINVASDVLENEKPFKESVKQRLKGGVRDMGLDVLDAARQIQLGKGLKRVKRRKSAKRKTKVTKRKTNKRKKRKTIKRKAYRFEAPF